MFLRRSILAGVALIAAAGPALAQAVVAATPAAPPMTWRDLILQVVLYVLGTGLTTAFGVIAYYLKQKFNIDFDDKQQREAHSAAMTGILLGASKLGIQITPAMPEDTRSQLIKLAGDYMTNIGAPKAVVALADKIPDPAVTATVVADKLAESKLSSLISAQATVGVTTAQPTATG